MKPNHAWLLPICAATLLACGSFVEPLPPPPDFSGVVNELRVGTSNSDPALVITRTEGNAVVHLPDDARVYRRDTSGALSGVALEALTPGTHVDVWSTGVELRSLPPQYFARQVVIR